MHIYWLVTCRSRPNELNAKHTCQCCACLALLIKVLSGSQLYIFSDIFRYILFIFMFSILNERNSVQTCWLEPLWDIFSTVKGHKWTSAWIGEAWVFTQYKVPSLCALEVVSKRLEIARIFINLHWLEYS